MRRVRSRIPSHESLETSESVSVPSLRAALGIEHVCARATVSAATLTWPRVRERSSACLHCLPDGRTHQVFADSHAANAAKGGAVPRCLSGAWRAEGGSFAMLFPPGTTTDATMD